MNLLPNSFTITYVAATNQAFPIRVSEFLWFFSPNLKDRKSSLSMRLLHLGFSLDLMRQAAAFSTELNLKGS